jgi:hypothetical protein
MQGNPLIRIAQVIPYRLRPVMKIHHRLAHPRPGKPAQGEFHHGRPAERQKRLGNMLPERTHPNAQARRQHKSAHVQQVPKSQRELLKTTRKFIRAHPAGKAAFPIRSLRRREIDLIRSESAAKKNQF